MTQARTEKPTPRRLRKAREQGQVARSRDLTGAILLLAFVVLVAQGGGALTGPLVGLFVRTFDGVGSAEPRSVGIPLGEGLEVFWGVLAPVLVVLFTLALLTSVLQVGGGIFTLRPLLPDLRRIHPGRGLKELFSRARMFALLRVLVVLVVVLGSSGILLSLHGRDLAWLPQFDPWAGARLAGRIALRWGSWLVPALLALGVVDLAVQRMMHLNRLKMSKEELRREQREEQGDPVFRGERQRLHREVSQFDLASAVQRATVVVVNPTHLAVALFYDRECTEAPELVAKGRGHLAWQLRQLAEEAGVPIVENAVLAHSLQDLEVGDQIPVELYEAVAEILRFVWELERSEEEIGA
ncbi:MAG: EscU/YscU/HrcU family type III secretion system export apparatus switch protein [Bradymonadales bacterium]|nr:EscU/YscU/HrcU family type III secretion system export apparatus switch protein [Bradymonadales bacterium]